MPAYLFFSKASGYEGITTWNEEIIFYLENGLYISTIDNTAWWIFIIYWQASQASCLKHLHIQIIFFCEAGNNGILIAASTVSSCCGYVSLQPSTVNTYKNSIPTLLFNRSWISYRSQKPQVWENKCKPDWHNRSNNVTIFTLTHRHINGGCQTCWIYKYLNTCIFFLSFGVYTNMEAVDKTATLPTGTFVEAVRTSCRALTEKSDKVKISKQGIDRFLSELDKKQYEELSYDSSVILPLKFSTMEEELNFISVINLLNFGSGYRLELHKYAGRG